MTRPIDRRAAFGVGLVVAGAGTARAATPPKPTTAAAGLVPNLDSDQTAALQAAIDHATGRGVGLTLPAGRYRVRGLVLRPGTHLAGTGAMLVSAGPGPVVRAVDAHGLAVTGLTIDGGGAPDIPDVLVIHGSRDVTLDGIAVVNGQQTGLRLIGVSGRITGSTFRNHAGTALWSTDATGLEIASNRIADCADNGILVWRSARGEDGTLITNNRITGISARSGGSGQYGNGINLYRADRVTVSGNRIADCAYSAIRANEASDVVLTGNGAARIGEVALYVEAADERPGAAGFEGAIIANNSVDHAASGIVVTNFANGGRLAVVQGNLVRNLVRREHEPRDKRGEGIAVEADALVSNNMIEGAPTCGIMIGWGRHMRDVVASGNLIRASRIGIAVSGDAAAGRCLLASNLISGARDGAIRAMNHVTPIGPDLAAGPGRGGIVVTGTLVA